MVIKKPTIGEQKTIAVIQTNAPKLLYGYGKAGNGYLDKYQEYCRARGRFERIRGTKTLANGAIIYVNKHRFMTRFSTLINNVLDLQIRFIIYGKTYSLDNVELYNYGKADYFIFTLTEFGK